MNLQSSPRRLALALGVVVCLLPARHALGQERERANAAPRSWPETVQQATRDGAFLPLSLTPTVGQSAAQGLSLAGYDSARDTATLRSFAEARLYGPTALRFGVQSNPEGELAPAVGGRVQFLQQRAHGLDAAAALFYKAEGFTEAEGELEAVLSLARRFEAWWLLASVAYGQDPEGHERDGEGSVALLRELSRGVQLGLDARMRFDLGSERARLRATGEPTFDLEAGPLLNVALGPVALAAHGGVSALQRVDQPARLGFVALGGVGTAF